jgi:hypothetical protein
MMFTVGVVTHYPFGPHRIGTDSSVKHDTVKGSLWILTHFGFILVGSFGVGFLVLRLLVFSPAFLNLIKLGNGDS